MITLRTPVVLAALAAFALILSTPLVPLPGTAPAVAPVSAPGRADDGRRFWPVGSRPAVRRGWEPPASGYGRGHRGVDLAAVPGSPVRAAAGGRVSFVGRVAGRGVLSITLPGTGDPPLRITYEPVEPLVAKGDEVVAGRPVATLAAGPSHCATGCLHWGLLRGTAYLDPLSLLPPELLHRGPSRLLPIFGVPEPPSRTTGR
ncbi:peptidoglycan DD-metalloendopeptidase family protein [Streptomyces sp. NPDC087658]|uniref:peptidoglycan DD-metalloendopeptidase family protein n=1 Tax=Streptomyces sp. NPDC087658 TaxID=3365800 RepID=UPI003817BD23